MSAGDPFGLAGQVLDGQFRVDKFIGEGGFSVVYRGHHIGLDEPIAVKCLKLPSAMDRALAESFGQRFREESRLHYRLSQGNLHIVRSIATGTTTSPVTGGLVPYMVLEWLEGRSLAADFEVRRAYGDRGRALPELVTLLDAAVDALAFAHAQGVVHRDFNPGNIFVTQTPAGPRTKVLDFGVAKIVSDHALALGPRVQTLGSMRIFAPAYGAPEQYDDRVGVVGPHTDVYAIAMILVEGMRDQPVIDGETLAEFTMKVLDRIKRPTPRALGLDVGDAVEAVFVSALSLEPDKRPRDAGEFWGTLKHALGKDGAAGWVPRVREEPSVETEKNPTNWAGRLKKQELNATLPMEEVPELRGPEPLTAAAAGISLPANLLAPRRFDDSTNPVRAAVAIPSVGADAQVHSADTARRLKAAEPAPAPAPVPAPGPAARPLDASATGSQVPRAASPSQAPAAPPRPAMPMRFRTGPTEVSANFPSLPGPPRPTPREPEPVRIDSPFRAASKFHTDPTIRSPVGLPAPAAGTTTAPGGSNMPSAHLPSHAPPALVASPVAASAPPPNGPYGPASAAGSTPSPPTMQSNAPPPHTPALGSAVPQGPAPAYGPNFPPAHAYGPPPPQGAPWARPPESLGPASTLPLPPDAHRASLPSASTVQGVPRKLAALAVSLVVLTALVVFLFVFAIKWFFSG